MIKNQNKIYGFRFLKKNKIETTTLLFANNNKVV